MQNKKMPGKNDAYLDSNYKPSGWVATQAVAHGKLAVTLIECEVNDPARFCFLNGSWFKIEQPG
jgi:hypothetical protein